MSENETKAETPNQAEYGSSSIQVLEGLEAVRKRPGMYIGDVHDGTGLHHLVWEVVDNAVDEHLAGHCKEITVTIHSDQSVTVTDDGRGIPVGMHEKGVSAAEVVMTVLHAGGKFNNDSYKVSAGLHGVGVSAVNAVSEWLKLEIRREGKVWQQEYRKGAPQAPIGPVGTTDRTGTKVSFKPDTEIFSVRDFQWSTLHNRLREIAFLNAGLHIDLAEESGEGRKQHYHFEGGIQEFVRLLNETRTPLHADVISISDEREKYTNNVHNKDGGTHLTGFRGALTKTINNYGGEQQPAQGARQGRDAVGRGRPRGAHGVISVKHPDPSVQLADQGQARLERGEGHRRERRGDKLGHVPRGEPPVEAKRSSRSACSPRAPARPARKARELVQRKGALDPRTCPASWPTVRRRTPPSARSTSSRATPPVARPSRAATASTRRSSRCAARS
jgi:DNA gyrase subunit B